MRWWFKQLEEMHLVREGTYQQILRGNYMKEQKTVQRGKWLDESEVGRVLEGLGDWDECKRVWPLGMVGKNGLYWGNTEVEQEGAIRRGRVMIGLLLGVGLRRSEAVEMRWKNWREVEGRMAVADLMGKGGKVCTVPVPDWVAKWVDEWERYVRVEWGEPDDEEDYVLSRMGAGRLLGYSAEWVKVEVERVCAGLGVKGAKGRSVRPHDLRRTLAKQMKDSGVGIDQIQMQLRHSSLVVTERYLGDGFEMKRGEAGVDRVRAWKGKNV
jgi:integrase